MDIIYNELPSNCKLLKERELEQKLKDEQEALQKYEESYNDNDSDNKMEGGTSLKKKETITQSVTNLTKLDDHYK